MNRVFVFARCVCWIFFYIFCISIPKNCKVFFCEIRFQSWYFSYFFLIFLLFKPISKIKLSNKPVHWMCFIQFFVFFSFFLLYFQAFTAKWCFSHHFPFSWTCQLSVCMYVCVFILLSIRFFLFDDFRFFFLLFCCCSSLEQIQKIGVYKRQIEIDSQPKWSGKQLTCIMMMTTTNINSQINKDFYIQSNEFVMKEWNDVNKLMLSLPKKKKEKNNFISQHGVKNFFFVSSK